MSLQHKTSFDIFLNNFGAHVFLVLASEELSKPPKAENTDSSCRETGLTNPHVLCPIDICILRVAPLQLLVHLVGLVHHVEVRYLPSAESEHIWVDVLKSRIICCLSRVNASKVRSSLCRRGCRPEKSMWVDRVTQFGVPYNEVQYTLIEPKVGLVVVLLDEFVTFAVLVG